MIQELEANIFKEKQLAKELGLIAIASKTASEEEKAFYTEASAALIDQLKLLNDAVPKLLEKISIAPIIAPKMIKPTEAKPEAKPAAEVAPTRIATATGFVAVSVGEKGRFLKDLQLEQAALRTMKKKLLRRPKVKEEITYIAADPFTKTASKLFAGISLRLAKTGLFSSLGKDIKRANMPYLLQTYISIMLLAILIAFFFSIAVATFLTFFKLNLATLTIEPATITLSRIASNFVLALILPVATFFVAYIVPSSNAASIKGKIDEELPFAIMHMAAIAGSGVTPDKIFRIITTGLEYPKMGKEARKIINLINFYGYDLVTALKATAKTTSSTRLADALNGMATNIATGGNLQDYLQKVASDALLDYKLRRKRFTTLSETYADMYTGLLIAAPLIFMLLLVLINIIGGGFVALGTETVALAGIGVIIVLNIGFLIFLQISMPKE